MSSYTTARARTGHNRREQLPAGASGVAVMSLPLRLWSSSERVRERCSAWESADGGRDDVKVWLCADVGGKLASPSYTAASKKEGKPTIGVFYAPPCSSCLLSCVLDVYANMYIRNHSIIIAYVLKYKNYTVTSSTSSYRNNQ